MTKDPISLLLLGVGLVLLPVAFALEAVFEPLAASVYYLGALLLIIAFTRRWKEVRSFLLLALGGFVGFPILVVMHNGFYAIAEMLAGVPLLPTLFQLLHVTAFLGALILCPAAVVVGLVGAVIAERRGRT